MKGYNGLIMAGLMGLCLPAYADITYFSCETGKGTVALKEANGVLHYTMIKNGKEAFSFASNGQDFAGFTYNHYARYQTDYLNVSFSNGGYRYLVFSNEEGNEERRGVTVINLKNSKDYTYECTSVAVDRLNELSEKLTCDIDSAQGCE